jgi:putative DNA primase/helicase
MNERLEMLDRCGRVYGRLGLAVVFTDGLDGRAAKRVTQRCWQRARRLADAEFGAALLVGRGEQRNVAVSLRPSGLIGFDIDGAEGLATLEQLELPLPQSVMVISGEGCHHWFRPPPGWTGGAKFEFAKEVVASTEGCLVVPPSIHESGRKYEFAPGRAPWEIELAELPIGVLARLCPNGARPKATASGCEDEPIREGMRNTTLTSRAGKMRRAGMGATEITAALLAVNAERCMPPLPEHEVESIARSVTRYAPAAAATTGYALTDLGNAELFAATHAERLRYVNERRDWLALAEGRWRIDVTGEAERAAKDIARQRLREAAELPEGDEQRKALRWGLDSQSEHRVRSMLKLAQTESGIVLRADDLDRDPMLLSCANGVLDLRSDKLRPHNPDDLISLGTDIVFDPSAACPRWERFLGEVFEGDADLIAYVQRLVGYCLTGDTREQIVPILYGTGGNGKDTFVRPLERILGEHAQTSPFDTFTRTRRDGGVRNDLARLHRARLVVASESNDGCTLDEATIKSLTGGGRIAARFLYGEYFEFAPRFKLFLITNHLPRVDGDDEAIWRRLRPIPFNASFIGREDKTLDTTLEGELPGILNWALTGCQLWQAEGLATCAAVETTARDYRADVDHLGTFIAERCKLDGAVPPAELRDAYAQFCAEIGEKPLAAHELGRRLKRRGVKKATEHREAVYRGISLTS